MAGNGVTLRELDDRPVTDLNGVGEKRAAALAKVDVHTVLDMLCYYPRRYLDRSREATISALPVGDEGMVLVRVTSVAARRTRNRRTLVEVRVEDETGSLGLTFFNQPWRERQLSVGTEAVVFGKVDQYQGRNQMTNPLVDLVGDRTGVDSAPNFTSSASCLKYTGGRNCGSPSFTFPVCSTRATRPSSSPTIKS